MRQKALPVEKTVIKAALRVPNHLEKAAIRLYVRLRMIEFDLRTDFDDETIELQNVLGEMGEITIRGKSHQYGDQRDP